MTDLNSVLPYWQRALGISDWDITIELKAAEEVGDEEFNLARCASLPGMRVAIVTVADPHPEGFDREEALVHELLHVATWHVSEVKSELGGIGWHIHEQFINQLSATLVKLRRYQAAEDERKQPGTPLPEYPFLCKFCKQAFPTAGQLEAHLSAVIHPSPSEYGDWSMPHGYRTLANVPTLPEGYACQRCGKEFETFLLMSDHIKTDHRVVKE